MINIKFIRPGYRSTYFLVFLCLALPFLLAAQPQILPPVEIGSDTVIKAPLMKKPLLFPTEVPADSLAPLVPRVLEVKHAPPDLKTAQVRPLYLNLGMNSSFGADLHASYYPSIRFIPILSIDASLGVPGSNRALNRYDAHLQTRLGSRFALAHDLVYQRSSGNDFSSSVLSYGMYNHVQELGSGLLSLSDLWTRLYLENLDQEQDAELVPGLEHAHLLNWKKHSLLNAFWLRNESYALSLQYRVPAHNPKFPNLELGLMTDFRHLLPAIDIHKRFVLQPNLYLELSNQASLQATKHTALVESHPWSLLPVDERFTMVPLDLSLQAYKLFRQEGFLQMIALSHNSKFFYNEPLLATLEDGKQTVLSYRDLLSNHSAIELRLNLFGLKLSQSLNLDLEHLPSSDWQRRPYSPLFSATTSTGFDLGDAEFSASFNQAYFQNDEQGNELPEILDLSLALRYPLSRDLRLKASLENIFNTPYHNYGDLPKQGRTLFISISYLPQR